MKLNLEGTCFHDQKSLDLFLSNLLCIQLKPSGMSPFRIREFSFKICIFFFVPEPNFENVFFPISVFRKLHDNENFLNYGISVHINKAPHYRDQLAIISDFPCAHHLCVTPSTGDMTLPLVGDTSSPSKGRKVMVLSPGEDEGMFVSPLDTYRTITPATPQVIEYVMQGGGAPQGGRGGAMPPQLDHWGGGIVPPPPQL